MQLFSQAHHRGTKGGEAVTLTHFSGLGLPGPFWTPLPPATSSEGHFRLVLAKDTSL